MKYLSITLLFLGFSMLAIAQDKLFTPDVTPKPRHGFIITGAGDFDEPGADMAKRFGQSFRLGFGVLYKTSKNWLFGAKCDFILGSDIREDSLMINIRDKYNTTFNGRELEFISSDGLRSGVPFYERGYSIGIEMGKIINVTKYRPDNGIMLLTTGGFIQHKIDIYDKELTVRQISGDYKKGYDRLTNGLFLEQYVGYVYFSKNRLINFHIGLDALFGFTQCRRDFLYDVMHADNNQRLDVLYGIRAGWYIPMFKRKSEDLLFN